MSRNIKKYQSFLSEIFLFLEVKFSVYLNRRVFVMEAEIWCSIVWQTVCLAVDGVAVLFRSYAFLDGLFFTVIV